MRKRRRRHIRDITENCITMATQTTNNNQEETTSSTNIVVDSTMESTAEQPRRKVYRRRRRNKNDIHAIPESISQNKALLHAIESSLPADYEFEIMKTIHRIQISKAKHVALQMPEGLLMYACTIADILKKFSVLDDDKGGSVEAISILGDVTYGGKIGIIT